MTSVSGHVTKAHLSSDPCYTSQGTQDDCCGSVGRWSVTLNEFKGIWAVCYYSKLAGERSGVAMLLIQSSFQNDKLCGISIWRHRRSQ